MYIYNMCISISIYIIILHIYHQSYKGYLPTSGAPQSSLQVKSACTLPVIASSGAGCPEHFEDALAVGEADAALAAGIFHREEVGPLWRFHGDFHGGVMVFPWQY